MYGGLQRGGVKRCIYQSKKEIKEQFGRKMNQDVDGKLFWKEESCSGIKDGRLALGEDKVRMWKDYFDDIKYRYSRADCNSHV